MPQKSRFEIPFCLLRGCALLVMKLGFGLEVRGLSRWRHLPGGLILAGNHTGYLDSLAVLAACHRAFKFLMRHEVFEWRVVGRLVPYANIIPLVAGREKRGLLQSVQVLQQGGALCIFPEGQLTPTGELGAFNPGVAYLQQKSRSPIVPFAICGGFAAWPEGARFPRFRRVAVVFGEPILPGEFSDREALTQALRERVQMLLESDLREKDELKTRTKNQGFRRLTEG